MDYIKINGIDLQTGGDQKEFENLLIDAIGEKFLNATGSDNEKLLGEYAFISKARINTEDITILDPVETIVHHELKAIQIMLDDYSKSKEIFHIFLNVKSKGYSNEEFDWRKIEFECMSIHSIGAEFGEDFLDVTNLNEAVEKFVEYYKVERTIKFIEDSIEPVWF